MPDLFGSETSHIPLFLSSPPIKQFLNVTHDLKTQRLQILLRHKFPIHSLQYASGIYQKL